MSENIQFYSTNLKSSAVHFRDALLKGLAPDGGLYMPSSIPIIPVEVMAEMQNMTYPEIAFTVSSYFLHDQLPPADLLQIVNDAYNFSVPLEHVAERKYIMRLDQGPTASFKDFAARMMGRLINYYLNKEKKKLLILTATSGDTGSAIANAFYGLESINVVVLFPEKEVTDRQRKQMTTLGKNIKIVSVDGKFDDCQALVKQAFNDRTMDYLNLSSANSINIGRLIPQINYYFYAWAKLAQFNEKITFAIPSGNFGNMMGCMLGTKMGLPVEKVIIATNENDEFPVFLNTTSYDKIDPSLNCISSAMNVGNPSNLPRLVALFGGTMDEKGNVLKAPDFVSMRSLLYSCSVTDDETREIISKVYHNYNVILEPHGAVAWKALENYTAIHNEMMSDKLCVSLETAHPAKFPAEINAILGIDPELPESLAGLENKPEYTDHIKNDYQLFKTYLQENY